MTGMAAQLSLRTTSDRTWGNETLCFGCLTTLVPRLPDVHRRARLGQREVGLNMRLCGSLYGHRGRKKLPLRARDMRAMRTVMQRLMRHTGGIWTWTWLVPATLRRPGETVSSTLICFA